LFVSNLEHSNLTSQFAAENSVIPFKSALGGRFYIYTPDDGSLCCSWCIRDSPTQFHIISVFLLWLFIAGGYLNWLIYHVLQPWI